MSLSSITLNGFKSFARATEIDLNFPITAFVGPNGSGKSNIADAMRWVIGEQAIKNIRASKQEDLIFSGSATSGPKGMAEVKVQFTNDDNLFDLPQAELAFSRIIHRDGLSEYWLNGQRILLREMHDIMARSRLGSYDLAVIGQGEIDHILIMGSREIQSLLEDASGVKPFYIKKNRIARNLTKASENLQRLQDILGELEPQLKVLERESRQAEAYESLVTELQTLQTRWYTTHYAALEQDLVQVQTALAGLSAERQKARTTLTKADDQMKLLEAKIVTKQTALKAQQGEIETLQSACQKQWQEQASVQARLEFNRSQLHSLEKKSEQSQKPADNGVLKSLEKERTTLAQTITETEAALAALREEEQEKDLAVRTERTAHQALLDQIQDKSKEQIKQLDTASIVTRVSEIQTLLVKLFQKLFAKKMTVDSWHKAISEGKHLHASLTEEAESLRVSLPGQDTAFQEEIKALREDLDEQARVLGAASLTLSTVRKQIEQLGPVLYKSKSRLQIVMREIAVAQTKAPVDDQSALRAALQKEESLLIEQQTAIGSEVSKLEGQLKSKKTALREAMDHATERAAMDKLRQSRFTVVEQLSKLSGQIQNLEIDKARLETKRDDLMQRAQSEFGLTLTDMKLRSFASLRMTEEGEAGMTEGGEAGMTERGEAGMMSKEDEDIPLPELENRIGGLKRKLERIGEVNQKAPQAYKEVSERYESLLGHVTDITGAIRYCERGLLELDQHIKSLFDRVFNETQTKFGEYFAILFGGGEGKLERYDNVFGEMEIVVKAKAPGKRQHDLRLLSGGERSLGAAALLFAILETCQTPFCVLDEVDAALDDANVGRFCEAIKRLNERTQIVLVTHNRRTMEVADCLYGATMNKDGITQIVSLKLEEYRERAAG